MMTRTWTTATVRASWLAFSFAAGLALAACDSPTSPEGPEAGFGESTEGSEGGGEGSESGGGEGAHGSEGGEGSGGSEPGESGVRWGPGQIADENNQGAHLLLGYDATSGNFTGTVENTTNAILLRVRVEVHLSTGLELGPTTPMDLAPGEIMNVVLSAMGQSFTWFTVHPEVG